MITYFIVLVIVFLFSNLAYRSLYSGEASTGTVVLKKNRDTNIFLFIVVAALTVTAGCRYHVGTDYGGYVFLYKEYAAMKLEDFSIFNEPMLPLIGKISNFIFNNCYGMFFIASVITVGFALYSMYKETNDFIFVTLLYIFAGGWLGTFNGVRQYLAVTIAFMGRGYIAKRKFWKFLLVCFIAFLAHRSALFFILVYFAYSEKFTLKRLLVIITATVVISRSYDTIFDLIGWMNDAEGELIDYATSSVNVFRTLVGCCPAILAIYFAYTKKLDDDQIFYAYMLIANAAIRVATSDSAYLTRLAAYTGVLVPLGLSSILKSNDKHQFLIIRVGIVVLYGIFWLYEITNSQTLREFEWIFGNI